MNFDMCVTVLVLCVNGIVERGLGTIDINNKRVQYVFTIHILTDSDIHTSILHLSNIELL